jgi:hypothetical protein
LYFAESPNVARSYQKSTSYQDAVRQFRSELPDDADFSELVEMAAKGQMTPQNARVVNALQADDWLGYDYPAQAITGAFKHGKSHDMSPELQAAISEYGNMYKVDIPDEAIPRMLDWDAPIAKQGEAMRNLAKQYGVDEKYLGKALVDTIAESKMSGFRPDNVGASEALKAAGIPGIRYLDGSSRNVGEGTSNFVLFDDQLPRILEINGQPTGLLSYADEAKKAKGLISEPLSMRQSTELGDVTLTESAKNPGQYQLTMWDGKLGQSKPVRDEQFKSKDEAIKAYKAMIGEK